MEILEINQNLTTKIQITESKLLEQNKVNEESSRKYEEYITTLNNQINCLENQIIDLQNTIDELNNKSNFAVVRNDGNNSRKYRSINVIKDQHCVDNQIAVNFKTQQNSYRYENENQVENFLASHKEFKVKEMTQLLPNKEHDGFFICVMKKN